MDREIIMNNSEALFQLGQSVWYDNIQRRLLKTGELAGMINRREIFGVTSNPSIFQNAIAKSTDYDSALLPMAWAGWSAEEVFWELAIEDIRNAADLFRPLYDETNGGDGYVSLEVNPLLAHNANETITQANELWARVDRENLMIKIPATKEGILAVEKTIEAGINVNVTLIFSLERYQEVIDAYLKGLESRIKKGLPIENIASVASFFVSRVDSKVDPKLLILVDEKGSNGKIAAELLGKTAISNVKCAYEIFKQAFTSARYKNISEKGGRLQRPLWASTSTKNAAYPDVIYVNELVGTDTVNTIPPATLAAFLDHGKASLTVDKGLDEAKRALLSLISIGISIDQVTQELEDEGVKSFNDAFISLLSSIEEKVKDAKEKLGAIQKSVIDEVNRLEKDQTVKRLFEVDPTLWTNDPAGQSEIRIRCNWLNAPWMKSEVLGEYENAFKHYSDHGFTHVLLLGMGGSSLAPEVLSLINDKMPGTGKKGLNLAILDSTDPKQVKDAFDRSELEKTVYIVSSKSGGTAEVNAYMDFFWAKAEEKLGKKAGEHFIAITDPGTKLEKIAQEKKFQYIFAGDPMVGGRNSALTAFGLVPAALIGMDLNKLIKNSLQMANQCVPEVPFGANPGAMLGAVIGAAWKQGKDKLSIITDPDWDSFGTWLEQLTAESSGKLGKGIVPIAQEPMVSMEKYGQDRLFVYIRSTGDNSKFVSELAAHGIPVIEVAVNDAYDLGGQFYLWEVAVAIACVVLKVNSFDQPDVQDNKTRTVKKIEGYHKDGKVADYEPICQFGQYKLFTSNGFAINEKVSIRNAINTYLKANLKKNDFVAINAYIPRNEKTSKELTELRKWILETFSVATTLGFGPRFLHSTGQLHKGGADNGVFIQITADAEEDLDIPTENLTFATLERAQAVGDFEALEARNRRVMRIQLSKPDTKLLLD